MLLLLLLLLSTCWQPSVTDSNEPVGGAGLLLLSAAILPLQPPKLHHVLQVARHCSAQEKEQRC